MGMEDMGMWGWEVWDVGMEDMGMWGWEVWGCGDGGYEDVGCGKWRNY